MSSRADGKTDPTNKVSSGSNKTSDLSRVFSHKEVNSTITLIVEKYYESWNRANIWLVSGQDRDLVVDAGIGVHNVAEYMKRAGLIDPSKKPVLAVASHIHFDHTGGLRYFDEVAIHSAEAESLILGDNRKTVSYLSDDEIAVKPYPNWGHKDYSVRPTEVTRTLSENDVIDLGDRRLRVLHVPGHSPGSVALLDESSDRFLFTGDVVYDSSDLIDWLPHSDPTLYARSARRLEELGRSGAVAKVFAGHGNPLTPQRLIDFCVNYQHGCNGFGKKLSRGFMHTATSAYFKLKHPKPSKI